MTVISEEQLESFSSLFDLIYKNDENAKKLSLQLLNLCNVWDDIIDGDNVDGRDVDNAFISALIDIPSNPLWFRFGLNHHCLNVFLRWRDANAIEIDKKSTDDDLIKCYMLRAGVYDVFALIAYHLHGDDWSRHVGPFIRKHYGEKPSEYLLEMRNA